MLVAVPSIGSASLGLSCLSVDKIPARCCRQHLTKWVPGLH